VLDDIHNFCLAKLSRTAAFIQWYRSWSVLNVDVPGLEVVFFTYLQWQ